MPEEGLETGEVKEQLDAAREHAEKAHESAHKEKGELEWLTWLSLSTAFLAALAAIASLHAGSLANQALLAKSDAVLAESELADNWAEYQSRSTKAYLFDTQAALLDGAGKKSAEEHGQHERAEADRVKQQGNALRRKVDAANTASGELIERHELFAKTVTIFQISIAVAAIAALTRKKPMWWLSMVGGAAGVVLLVLGLAAPSGEKPAGEATPPEKGAAPR